MYNSAKRLTFKQCEQRERMLLQHITVINPRFKVVSHSRTNSYATYDSIMEQDSKAAIVEVKVRDIKADRYPTAFLEYAKLNRLLQKQKELKERGEELELKYYAFYPLSKELYIFDLNTCPYTKSSVWAARTTAQGGSAKVQKIMVEFNLQAGERISLIKPVELDDTPKIEPLF